MGDSMFIPPFIFILTVLLHVIADFNVQIQGRLNEFKCREWWEKNAPSPLYKYDYLIALWLHGFCWAAITFIPLLLIGPFRIMQEWYVVLVFVNAYIHAIIDSSKANKKGMNLWGDQFCHLLQIIATNWFAYYALDWALKNAPTVKEIVAS